MLRHRNVSTLITQMRQEAKDSRSCFRSLSVQTMGFAALAIAAILAALNISQYVAFASFGVAIVIMAVQRIGIHKFTTANRLYGYQLHLERMDDAEYERLSIAIGWEEAFRAWRIVQASVFESIYSTPRNWFTKLPFVADFWPRYYRPICERDAKGCWWRQSDRAGGKYHAGSYLARMFSILEALALFSLLPPLGIPLIEVRGNPEMGLWKGQIDGPGWIAITIVGLFLPFLFLNRLSIGRRRKILEDELLSIHSCAIMWKATVLAHNCAWSHDKTVRRQYTERLARISCWFAKSANSVRTLTDLPNLPEWFAIDEPNQDKLMGVVAELTSPESHARRVRSPARHGKGGRSTKTAKA